MTWGAQYAGVAISHSNTDISQIANAKRAATHTACKYPAFSTFFPLIIQISRSLLYYTKESTEEEENIEYRTSILLTAPFGCKNASSTTEHDGGGKGEEPGTRFGIDVRQRPATDSPARPGSVLLESQTDFCPDDGLQIRIGRDCLHILGIGHPGTNVVADY